MASLLPDPRWGLPEAAPAAPAAPAKVVAALEEEKLKEKREREKREKREVLYKKQRLNWDKVHQYAAALRRSEGTLTDLLVGLKEQRDLKEAFLLAIRAVITSPDGDGALGKIRGQIKEAVSGYVPFKSP